MHTNDAAGAVTRLLDMGIEPFLISASLYGVLSQRLVRVICSACGGRGVLHSGKCRVCGGTGFRGRTGIFELLVINDVIRNAIHEKVSGKELSNLAREQGMIPLLDDGKRTVAEGITTREEILRLAAADFEEE